MRCNPLPAHGCAPRPVPLPHAEGLAIWEDGWMSCLLGTPRTACPWTARKSSSSQSLPLDEINARCAKWCDGWDARAAFEAGVAAAVQNNPEPCPYVDDLLVMHWRRGWIDFARYSQMLRLH